jgi:hypothetical protein
MPYQLEFQKAEATINCPALLGKPNILGVFDTKKDAEWQCERERSKQVSYKRETGWGNVYYYEMNDRGSSNSISGRFLISKI